MGLFGTSFKMEQSGSNQSQNFTVFNLLRGIGINSILLYNMSKNGIESINRAIVTHHKTGQNTYNQSQKVIAFNH